MILYRTPGRSFTRPPRTSTIECSCRLWPMPGMYAVTSIWLVRRTFATLRRAEFGFFGVVVYTRVQTPRFCGFCSIAGTFDLAFCGSRPLRISWLIVGMKPFTFRCRKARRLLCSTEKSAEPKQPYGPPGDAHVEQCSALARR